MKGERNIPVRGPNPGWQRWKERGVLRLFLSAVATILLFLLVPAAHLAVLYLRGPEGVEKETEARAAVESASVESAAQAGDASAPAAGEAASGNDRSALAANPLSAYQALRRPFLDLLGETFQAEGAERDAVLREVEWICLHPAGEDAGSRLDPGELAEAAHHLRRLGELDPGVPAPLREDAVTASRDLKRRAIELARAQARAEEEDRAGEEDASVKGEPAPGEIPHAFDAVAASALPGGTRVPLEEGTWMEVAADLAGARSLVAVEKETLLVATRSELVALPRQGGNGRIVLRFEAHLAPVLSPRGDRLAWVTWDDARNNFAVEVAPRNGLEPGAHGLRVGEGAPFVEALAFARDGDTLFFDDGEGWIAAELDEGTDRATRRLAAGSAPELLAGATVQAVESWRAEIHPSGSGSADGASRAATWTVDLVREGSEARVPLDLVLTAEPHLAWAPDGSELYLALPATGGMSAEGDGRGAARMTLLARRIEWRVAGSAGDGRESGRDRLAEARERLAAGDRLGAVALLRDALRLGMEPGAAGPTRHLLAAAYEEAAIDARGPRRAALLAGALAEHTRAGTEDAATQAAVRRLVRSEVRALAEIEPAGGIRLASGAAR